MNKIIRLLCVAALFFTLKVDASTIIFDTGDTSSKAGIGLIRPTSYIYDENGVVDNGQSVAISFSLEKAVLVNSLSSLFNVTYSGDLRISIFDNHDDQPNSSLISKTIKITDPGWQGIDGFDLKLNPNKYWAVFDFPPEISSTFYGSLVFYDVESKTQAYIKSNYSTQYSNPYSGYLSGGLRLTGSVIPVPEAHISEMLIFGLVLAIFVRRRFNEKQNCY